MDLPISLRSIILIGTVSIILYSGFITFIGVSMKITGRFVVYAYSKHIPDQSVTNIAASNTVEFEEKSVCTEILEYSLYFSLSASHFSALCLTYCGCGLTITSNSLFLKPSRISSIHESIIESTCHDGPIRITGLSVTVLLLS